MKANDNRKSLMESAKEVALSFPRITEEDINSVFSENIEEKIYGTPSFRKLYFKEHYIGEKNFNIGNKNPFEVDILEKKSKKKLISPTDYNIFWQNDISFVRNIYRWLIRQEFHAEYWATNYFDPTTKVIRIIKSSPSVWLAASSVKHNLLVDVIHVHGKRGFLVKTPVGDKRPSTIETKICDTIISIKNYIKSKYMKDTFEELLESIL